MTIQSEAQLESALIERLTGKGWVPVTIPNETALWENLRKQLGLQNGTDFSAAEFARIRNHLEKGSIFEKSETLRSRFGLERDDGTHVYIRFMDTDHWCRNRYQVASQIGIDGQRKNRYDVTLLINGLPMAQVELKRRGMELKTAFDQINRYQRDSFRAAGGLFMFIQIFVISNGMTTRYYANNRHQSFKQTFAWSDIDNKPMKRLEPFTDFFLEKCHLSKMIARYVVRNTTEQTLMVLRPYQFYAAEKIQERVELRQGDGYIWHTTGSGKTLTSFKTAQNLIALPKIEKVLFVVDRADLDDQTVREFNHFKKDSVDATTNTAGLVEQMLDPTVKLIVTTIQKLNTAITRDRYALDIEEIGGQRVVLIFDECHRSQFGDTHQRIRDFFPKAQMFGFTGTPILAENAIGQRTTRDLFGEPLHKYVITDAIRDENVLRFSVEYMAAEPPAVPDTGDAKADRKATRIQERLWASRDILEHPGRIATIAEWIVENHDRKTRGRQFGAIMATGTVDGLIAYYEAFERLREEGRHDLRIATIFTYAANEDDPDADGILPDPTFPEGQPNAAQLPKRDRLAGFVADYNKAYGTNESVNDGKGFYTYYRNLGKRVKSRDYKPFDPAAGVDILLVVNMFLTGFDARTVNTLYVDKNLRYHGLIQAFSRTNRILNAEKSQGNIVCFRDLKERTDEAIALFADRNARDTILVGPYEEQLRRYRDALASLMAITPTVDAVDALRDEEAEAEFAKAFRELMRARNVLSSYSEFDAGDLPMAEQEFEDFKSKYLDLAQKGSAGGDLPEITPLAAIDFELELLRRDDINVAYIIALLTSLNIALQESGASGRKAREQRRRIFELLTSEVQLRGKREIIEAFIDRRMPMLAPGQDVREAFRAFWDEERIKAHDDLVAREDLDPVRFNAIISDYLFSGKLPLPDTITNAMNNRPRPLQRAAITRRISAAMQDLVETFDGADLEGSD